MAQASRLLVFAKTTPGLELALKSELSALLSPEQGRLADASQRRQLCPSDGVVPVWVTHQGLWTLVHRVRTAEHLRLHLSTLALKDTSYLTLGRAVTKIPWRNYFLKGVLPVVKVTLLPGSALNPLARSNTSALRTRLGKWIGDRLQGTTPTREPDATAPDLGWVDSPRFARISPSEKQTLARERFADLSQVHLRMANKTHVLLDLLAGWSPAEVLDRRGYRVLTSKMSLREHLAAACLRLANLPPECTLWDPFCGSGTLPIEYAALVEQVPSFWGEPQISSEKPISDPHFSRTEFAFTKWPIFKSVGPAYQEFLDRLVATTKERLAKQRIRSVGSDVNAAIVSAAKWNCARSRLSESCAFLAGDFARVKLPTDGPIAIVTHIPYGIDPRRRRRQVEKKKLLEKESAKTTDWKRVEEARWRGELVTEEKADERQGQEQDNRDAAYEMSTRHLYRRFGRFLKKREDIALAYVLTAHPRFAELTRLHWEVVASFFNRGVPVSLYKLRRDLPPGQSPIRPVFPGGRRRAAPVSTRVAEALQAARERRKQTEGMNSKFKVSRKPRPKLSKTRSRDGNPNRAHTEKKATPRTPSQSRSSGSQSPKMRPKIIKFP